nr:DUF58 domain-containing protein [Anaerolineae bacterium]
MTKATQSFIMMADSSVSFHLISMASESSSQRSQSKEWVLYRRETTEAISCVHMAHPLLLAVFAGLIIAAILLPGRAWIAILSGLGFTLLSGLGWVFWQLQAVSLERKLLHAWSQVGDRLEELFVLRNNTPLPILLAEIVDYSTLPGHNISKVRTANGNGETSWRETSVAAQRGLFQIGPTTLRFGDILGVVRGEIHYKQSQEVLVYPPVLHHLALRIPPGGGQGSSAVRVQNVMETASVGSIRDYTPGDPVRRIHWPLSLRHRDLKVKEFDQFSGGDTWILLDTQDAFHAGTGQESTLEYGIIWAASWAWYFLNQGTGIGLFTCGPDPIIVPPARGSGQLWEILRALAPIETQENITLDALLQKFQPRIAQGHSLVVITPSQSQDWCEFLMNRALRAVAKEVLLFDAETFGGGKQAVSIDTIRSLLVQQGIRVQCIEKQPGIAAEPAAQGTGDWDFFVTGFGKVIVRAQPGEGTAT